MDLGYSAAVAARLAIAGFSEPVSAPAAGSTGRFGGSSHMGAPAPEPAIDRLGLSEVSRRLSDALDGFDDSGANRTLDALLAAHGLEVALCDVILPLLNEIGCRWAANEVTVAQEHFASALLTGRLRALARGWDEGEGPLVLAACPSGESHDLGLLCFSLMLREHGHRIAYLGGSVPGDALFDAAQRLAPEVLVISAVREEPFWNAFEALNELSDLFPMAIGGAGSGHALADQLRARLLPRDLRQAVPAVATIVTA